MRATFDEAKDIVLVAAYETLYGFADWDSLGADDIQARLDNVFALGFTRRVLTSLTDSGLIGLVGTGQFENDGPVSYSLTDEGLQAAERLPSLRNLIARLKDYNERSQSEVEIPASDRIVSLSHNQVEEAVRPVNELIDALEQDNGDPEQPGLRERLLGQIKAGRELIRAGEFRVYLLYEVLVRALSELIDRYKNPTIKALANALLGAVVSQMMQSN
ncbi:hypothetical protein ACNFJ7_03620 [Sphingomonas sp. HT-1]|uniref:hypothetical protein n=1 Tax=unclassified Sphingomonas TaxID=196159 RepID=UPI00035E14A9|nr:MULTISPECIES: hypothetical protein [unclassified Sphingomonas]KTF69216.1 hypothetical protein ATB93_10155 [Sphingomonas sp. WG]